MNTSTPASAAVDLKPFNENELNTLARTEGPCITIQLPGFHPGAPDGSRSNQMRQLTQTAIAQLRDFDPSAEIDSLIATLEAMAEDSDSMAGGPGVTLCVSPGLRAVFATPGVTDQVTVGDHFHVLHMIKLAKLPHEIYALGVNQNQIRLWKVAADFGADNAKELALPPGVPASLEAAGGYDAPDHDLENRSSAGPSVGGMRVRFGTGSDHSAAYLHRFFKLVADGLRPTIQNTPVLLIGVHEELAEYRRSATHCDVLETEWRAASAHVNGAEVATHAQEAALLRYRSQGEALLQALPDSPARILGDIEAITRAACEGRIHRLLAAEAAQPADEVNTAVVEALKTRAEVLTRPGDTIPGIGALGAILRY